MVHPRLHEQAHRVLHFVGSTHGVDHAVVVIDGVLRRDAPIVPSVVQEEPSSLCKKLFQIRIDRGEGSIVHFISERDIAVEVQRAIIPVRVLEY